MMSWLEGDLAGQSWTALTAEAPAAAGLVEVEGRAGYLPSRFAVEEVATACVATALMAASALQDVRGGRTLFPRLERAHVAFAVRSERYFRRDGRSEPMGFAPLSRFWRPSDGWVRTHANFPWHRAALAFPLSVSRTTATRSERRWPSAARRTSRRRSSHPAVSRLPSGRQSSGSRHPQGLAVSSEPLVAHRNIGSAAARRRPPTDLPVEGVRVLDLTRVIAGPVCTRYLAALGAEVLRIDPPDRPDLVRGEPADTLLGKRSAILDARTHAGASTLHDLAAVADVIVCGYRPGALERFGLAEDDLAESNPGAVLVSLDAWGHTGPWAGRRGFDSIVQAPSGIAATESADGFEPGALPCQLLDHGTGYLAAAAALDGLRRQALEGGTHVAQVVPRAHGPRGSPQRQRPPRSPLMATSTSPDGGPTLISLAARSAPCFHPAACGARR